MSRLVTVSRAAKLVGVSRGNLQRRIRDGEIQSFEGMVDLSTLAEHFPNTNFEDNSMLEKLERIIENAARKARTAKTTTLPPDMETLATRVNILSEELVESKLEISIFYNIFDKLKSRLNHLAKNEPGAANAIRDLQSWLLKEIETVADKKFEQFPLLATDTFLRIMAAQVRLEPSGHEFFVEGSNSILESGLSSGLALNYGCSNGNCGKCKARLLSGEVKKIRNHDYVLSEKDKIQGYILTCSNTAVTDVILDADEAGSENDIPEQTISAWARKSVVVNDNTRILHVKTPRTQRLRFLAGQQVKLEIPGIGTTHRHVASCPCDDMNLQFHINRDDENAFVNYVYNQLRTNDVINIIGPSGHFVLREDQSNPIVFIAFGQGFAPIKSLIEHAMTLDVTEHIHLYWAVTDEDDLYMHNQCRSWSDAFERFTYIPLIATENNIVDAVAAHMQAELSDLGDRHFYIAGAQKYTDEIKNALTDQGVTKENLFIEPVRD